MTSQGAYNEKVCAIYGHNWLPWRYGPVVRQIGKPSTPEWRERTCMGCAYTEREALPQRRNEKP